MCFILFIFNFEIRFSILYCFQVIIIFFNKVSKLEMKLHLLESLRLESSV
jgi:hypothetical protein